MTAYSECGKTTFPPPCREPSLPGRVNPPTPLVGGLLFHLLAGGFFNNLPRAVDFHLARTAGNVNHIFAFYSLW